MTIIKKCPECGNYTLEEKCPKCGCETKTPHPPKYSPEDKYGKYRRIAREKLKE